MTLRTALVLTVAFTALSACTESSEPAPTSSHGTGPSYVAIGDSYTSGPGIDHQLNEAGFCLRSSRNYPSLLAEKLDVSSFVDVSCAGADTDDLLNENVMGTGATFPAQLDAVSTDTELVTIGLGGNDGRLFSNLFGSCGMNRGQRSGLCGGYVTDTAPPVLNRMRKDLRRAINAVQDKAPQARIIVVGYLRLIPGSDSCDDMPIAPQDRPAAIEGARALEAAQRGAAADAGVEFLSMREAGKGHDACAGSQAWVNGVVGPAPGDGVTMHPNAEGMVAVADQLARLLS